ncbi:hypothetical protein [Tateyamaria pelophila]|uniref:hypothetical protein n=1 Tax=Tateyamaria pelophila TaxID=328415 RepID=UPI001CBC8562|nr:hypothetical protein [Tateyamaria pelophila]
MEEYEVKINGHAEWVTIDELIACYQLRRVAQARLQEATLLKMMYERLLTEIRRQRPQF